MGQVQNFEFQSEKFQRPCRPCEILLRGVGVGVVTGGGGADSIDAKTLVSSARFDACALKFYFNI